MTTQIKLTRGFFATVDDEDYELVAKYSWQVWESKIACVRYAITTVIEPNGKRRNLKMHRLLTGVTNPKILVDHKDGDGLNNCRSNLRIATATQNKQNGRKYKNNTSGFKGVSWSKGRRLWAANIRVEKKLYFLGAYEDASMAAKVYDQAALRHFGEYARLNFPVGTDVEVGPDWASMKGYTG